MYIRPSHRARSAEDVAEAMRRYPFATLVTGGEHGLMASHLPFMFDASRGEQGTLLAHMARANPQAAEIGNGECLVMFQGPHAYISPSWYEDRATAPTWDYVAIHCYGHARVHTHAEAAENIARLVTTVETGARPWSIDELSTDSVDAMIRNVVSFEIPLTRIEGKFKLNQGETAVRNRAAVEQLERQGDADIAAWMRRYNSL